MSDSRTARKLTLSYVMSLQEEESLVMSGASV